MNKYRALDDLIDATASAGPSREDIIAMIRRARKAHPTYDEVMESAERRLARPATPRLMAFINLTFRLVLAATQHYNNDYVDLDPLNDTIRQLVATMPRR